MLSALVAAIPIFVLFMMLGVLRKPAWMSAAAALVSALLVALFVYGMPVQLALLSTIYGAAYGMFPIAWIVFASIMLYRLAVDTGKFEIIKDSVGSLTDDRRLQAMFIAFSFGAFIEGAAGFGAPVAVSGAMLAGLGFNPFYAAGICLLANTAPVAFGSIGIPVTTLANVTGLPVLALSGMVGKLCAMISIIIPGYLIVVMAGGRARAGGAAGDRGVRRVVRGRAVLRLELHRPGAHRHPELAHLHHRDGRRPEAVEAEEHHAARRRASRCRSTPIRHSGGAIFMAWVPYLLLVVFVLVWGEREIKPDINMIGDYLVPDSLPIVPSTGLLAERLMVPGLHNLIERVPPVVAKASPYNAFYELNWLSASGTACLLAIFATALVLRVRPARVAKVYVDTFKQLKLALLTIACMLGLAYLMNYSGMTSTLGLALAGTGGAFPFFSAVVGWLGVFLTGSDTSANALFGNLQVVTANALGLNPILTASVNSAAGVMGKMISVQSIAVAVAATGMSRDDESRLFRFTIKHSVLLMVVMGIISLLYAYVFPEYVPTVTPK